MAQQINLCTPLFLKQKKYFSGTTMGLALAVFLVLGGVLSAYWSWNMNQLGEHYQRSIGANLTEIDRLKTAIRAIKDDAAPAGASVTQELQARRAELQQREQLVHELKQGLVTQDTGHSARLRLLSQSIPAQVWLTGAKADAQRLELSGYTLEPAMLNPWMERLSGAELLREHKFSTVKVELAGVQERSGSNLAPAPVLPASMQRAALPNIWAFTLVSMLPDPAAPVAGAKP